MTENEVAKVVLDAAFPIHTEIGPGVFETVYEVLVAYELRDRGLRVERQVPIPVVYCGIKFDEGFRADLIVEEIVIVEIKSLETLLAVHRKQLYTQLRLSHRKLGLPINFGEAHLKNGIKRIANGMPDDEISL